MAARSARLAAFLSILAFASPVWGTNYTFSLGDCSSLSYGSKLCYANTTPFGDEDCTDLSPYCDDDTDCVDSDYLECSGSNTDYSVLGNTTVNYATIGFSSCSAGGTDLFIRKGSGGFQTATPSVICWDTSVLPDGNTVTGATFVFWVDQVSNADSRNLVGEWYSDDGACDGAGADWTKTVGSTAFSVALSSLALLEQNVVALSAPDTVSKTGLTCLRLGIDGLATTGSNVVEIAAFESLTSAGPLLNLDDSAPTSTPTITNTPVNTAVSTSTPTRTPSPTNTLTPTETGTSTPTLSPTNSPTSTETPMSTSTMTSTPTSTGTNTPMDLSTSTPTATSGTPTATVPNNCAHETIERIPVRDSAFVPDNANFLCDEDVERYKRQFFNFVVAGGEGMGSGSTLLLTPLEAFVDGGYLTEESNVDLSGHPSTNCWVVVSKFTSGNFPPFLRVAGTHYLVDCGATKLLPLPKELMWLWHVTTNGAGNIIGHTDLRGFVPSVRTVETETELNLLLDIRKGQQGQTLDTGGLYYFFQNEDGSVAEWQLVGIEGNAVLIGGDQTISGIKAFNEFPVKVQTGAETTLDPSTAAQFTTKHYVDSQTGFSGSTIYDPPNLGPLASVSALVPVLLASTSTGVCLASHSGLDEIYPAFVQVSAYPVSPNGVLVSFLNVTGGGVSVNIPPGTLRVKCVNVDF